MHPLPSHCYLVLESGLRVPVKVPGLLIGRSAACHVGIDDEHVSRRQAQIWLGTRGVELIPLGRNPVMVNGVAHSAPVLLADGDGIVVADRTLRVEIISGDAERDDDAQWTLEHGSVWYGLTRAPFAIGGGDDDDLVLRGWSDGAARLHQVQAALFLEVDADGVTLNDEVVPAGSVEPLGDDDRLGLGDFELRVHRRTGAGVAPTRALTIYPERVELHILPRGGRLALWFAGVMRTLVVSERRLELLSVLLQPPPPLRPGEFVADDLLLQRVWPRSDRADHSDLNVLVHRLRRDLIKAGVNGPAIIAREAAGGGTRFTIHATTVVTIVGG